MRILSMTTLALAALLMGACKSKTSESQSTEDSAQTTTSTSTPAATDATTAEPVASSHKVSFSPEVVTLGKSKEANVKLVPGTATDLTTPDGKSEGQEIRFIISVTNNQKIGGSSFSIYPSEFRLLLDDNTLITQESGSSFSIAPESTEESNEISFRVPAGKKAKTLNLYYDETRIPVQVNIEE
jgi:hypothetical protein